MDDCPICLQPIDVDDIVATIDQPGESGRYHYACIGEWIKKSTNGILTHTPIDSLDVLQNQQLICKINLIIQPKEEELDDYCPDFCILF